MGLASYPSAPYSDFLKNNPWMGGLLAGMGGVAGAIPTPGNTSSSGSSSTQQNTSGSTTTTPNLSPQMQALMDQIVRQSMSLTTPSLSGYQAGQTQSINRTSDLQSQAVNNIMAARGLGTSPVAGTAQANVEAGRFGQINQMNASLPLLLNQLNQSNLAAASGGFRSLPFGQTSMTNQSATGQTQQQQQQTTSQGGGVGGAVGGIGAVLASLFSDVRLKENVVDIPSDKAVSRILALHPKTWKWRGSEVEDSGLIAQELKKVMPELVEKDPEGSGFLKVNYAGLIGELVAAVQGIAGAGVLVMAQGEVNQILEGLKIHQQRQIAQAELRQNEQQQLRQSQAEANRIKMEQDRLQAEVKQHEIENAANLAAHKLAAAQASQQLGLGYAKTGVAPAGSQVSFNPEGPQAGGAPFDAQVLKIPGAAIDGGDLTIPTMSPTAYATQQADVARITGAPAEESKIRESRALQADLLAKQEAAKKDDFERQEAAKKADFEREVYKVKAEDARAAAKNATDLQIAKLRIAQGTEPTYDIAPHVQEALSGDLTLEQFTKLPLPKADKNAISNSVAQSGGRFITQAQQDMHKAITNSSEALKVMQNFIDNSTYSDNTAGALAAAGIDAARSDMRSDLKRMEGRALLMAQIVSGQPASRISDRDVRATLAGFTPRLTDTTKNKITQYNKYVDILNKKVTDETSGLSPAQQAILKAKFGFPFKHYEGSKTAAPRVAAPQPLGNTGAPQLAPETIQYMQSIGMTP